MKTLFTGVLILLYVTTGSSQSGEKRDASLSIGMHYTYEIVFDGYVHVREWELRGDKMSLNDLGVNGYPALNMFVSKKLSRNRSLLLSYDRYFMHGTSYFDRDIAYNGTLINARNGIDVSPTRYYRLTFKYTGNLDTYDPFDLQYVVGLVYDHVTFYMDGDVSEFSVRDEVYEQFGRQAFPYPFVGLKGTYHLNDVSEIDLSLSGTYIPEFKSFFTEGGPVYLQYGNFQADLSYVRHINQFNINIGAKTRYMHLLQRSEEDTNLLSTFTGGPYLGVVYKL